MNILFVVSAPFPYGSAFSSRARNIIKLLCDCGHNVHLMTIKGNAGDDSVFHYEMGKYHYSQQFLKVKNNRLEMLGSGTDKPYISAIKSYLRSNVVDLIFVNNITYVVPKINRLAQRKKIPCIIEQCEWFDHSTFKFGRFNPMYQECMRMIDHKICKLDGVVAISCLLEKHYRGQGMETIRIPTILDTEIIRPRLSIDRNHQDIDLAFAGSLGKGKEKLGPMLQAVRRVNQSESKIRIHIYGANEAQVLQNIGGDQDMLNAISSYTRIYGRIPQETVEEKVRAADFTFIMRPHRRSSDAGFPTKLAESMAVGTPVIANDTGDISLYVKTGISGFMMEDDSVEGIVKTLESVLAMDHVKKEEMRTQARKTAEKAFDYRQYCSGFSQFLHQVISPKDV